MNRLILAATFSMATLICATDPRAGDSRPPPELLQLEREVSLQMAHAHDAIQPHQMKQLSDAHQVDLEGEQALKAGKYDEAERDFLKTKVMLHDLGI
jgi:hypothetical protein